MTGTVGPRTVAVVVAYNRRELLIEALEALARQTVPLAEIVVVDNASDDGTGNAVRRVAPHVDLMTLTRNTGGAGGFGVGTAQAIVRHGADLIWLMDDDTIPTPTALEALLRAMGDDPAIAIAGSRVVWTDGQDHPMNTPRAKPFVGKAESLAAQSRSAVPPFAARRSYPCWCEQTRFESGACPSPTTSSGTTTSSFPPGSCAANAASSCPQASSCTRRRCSARRTWIRANGFSTRCATSSGFFAIHAASTRPRRSSTPARPSGAGRAHSAVPPTDRCCGEVLYMVLLPVSGPDRGRIRKLLRILARPPPPSRPANP